MSNHTRYRRIIDAYRGALLQVDETACRAVDVRVETWGEAWVSADALADFDKLMTAGEIAERFGLQPHNIRDWARRHPDEITTHRKGRAALFQLRQVLQYQARRR